jgi:DNA-binding CsgD family transcriptional regulator
VAHPARLAHEPGPDRPAEVVVVVEPARPEELAWLGPDAYGLTPREREVAALVARGASTDRIAATLHISPWTVQNHLSNVFDKVGVRTRPAMVRTLFLDHLYPTLFG